MTKTTRFLFMTLLLALTAGQAEAGITLGMAADFAVLAGSTVTNAGATNVNYGDIGVSYGTSITGFAPGTLDSPYTFHTSDALAVQANADLTSAYNAAVAMTPTASLTGQDLGGLTLTPGVYYFATSAQLTGTLTLDDQGNPNAQFIFQVGSTLTTSNDSSVVILNGGSTPGNQVFWQVGTSATIGTSTAFEGTILAQTSITVNAGATILSGSTLAMTGAVTLNDNAINGTSNISSVPEPATGSLMIIGGALLGLPGWKKLLGRWRRPMAR